MQRTLWEGDTMHGHYQVVDCLYDGRMARVLYSGDRQAAQSGMAMDANPDLLFDYNQRLLELARGIEPSTILVIGGGVGTLTTALLDVLPDVRVDAVEPDPKLTVLGHEFFDLPINHRLRIFHQDGQAFLREHCARYDMIVIDAYDHTTIPTDLRTTQVFRAYQRHLGPGGLLAMNVISGYYAPSAHVLKELYTSAVDVFGAAVIFLAGRGYSRWLPQNFVLVTQRGAAPAVAAYTRGEPIDPPS